MQCLLDVLRGEAGRRGFSEPVWEHALALAEEHHVLPLVAVTVLASRIALPFHIQAYLAQARREALHYAFLQTSELRELLQAFAGGDIPVLPIKGPSLASRLYGASSMRISCDHDLLVQGADFSRATLLLQRLNFAAHSVADDYHQKWSRGTTIVELHYDVENPLAIDFDIENAWKRARLSEFSGCPAWQLTQEDELRYLCLHGVRHRFSQLSHILDIAMAVKQLGRLHDVSRRAAEPLERTSSVLQLGCAMTRRLFPESPGFSAPDHGSVEHVAERLWDDLLTRPPIQQDWVSMHRFYLELEPNALKTIVRRGFHLRILLNRVIDDDFRFAARFGLRRRWQAWILRPMRLALRRRFAHKDDGVW